MSKIQSKNALPTAGYLSIDFTFKIVEAKRLGFNPNKSFSSSGTSKIFQNVRANTQRMKINAIYNGVKKKFPNGTVTPYDVVIYTYNYVYYLERYQYTEKNNKYYERYRDKENKRTRYYRADRYLLNPEQKIVFEDK